MSDFLKRFLLEDARRLSANGRYVALAAFGKHPGWDDHVEDLGLETESLNIAKTHLYVNGIGGQIDSGAWEKLEPAQQLPAFKHIFVWQRSGQIIVGRMWSSSDGKGRKRYPMVVCAHFIGITLGWALKIALPALAEIEEGCVRTTAAEEVRALLNRKRTMLREALLLADNRGDYAPLSPDALHRIMQPAVEAKLEGFLRVLYQVQGQLGSFAPGARAGAGTVRAQQIRVPAAAENSEEILLFWSRFFLTGVDPAAPLLLTLPLDEGWVDVTVGEPESHEFFCLRASPKTVPLVSEVPYKLDGAFRAKAMEFLAAFQRGEPATLNLKSAPAPALPGAAPAKSGWRKWLGVGAVFIIAGVSAFLLLRNDGQSDPAKAPPKTGTTETAAVVDPAKAEAAAKLKAESEAAAKLKTETEAAAKLKAESDAAAKLKAEADAAAKLKAQSEAAAKLKAEEEAAAKLKAEAETARLKAEAEAKTKAEAEAAAKQKAENEARAKAESAAVPTATSPASGSDSKPSGTANASATGFTAPVGGSATNSVGMILVHLASGIWAGKFEVTQTEYQKVMGNNPSKSVSDRQPVEQVSWHNAVEFAHKLTEMERDKLPAGMAYALPTDGQWKELLAAQRFEELPGRGFTGRSRPLNVGQGPANKLGLFDVLGNVWEWTMDSAAGDKRLLKGGAFNSISYDQSLAPDSKLPNCGFRCILVKQ